MQRGQVKAWTEAGFTQDEIAARLEISPPTLRKHCREELDNAGMDLIAAAVRQLGRMALGAPAQFDEHNNCIRAEVQPNLGAICFLLKTKGKKQGWTERLEMTGKDGKALFPDMAPLLAQMTDEELELVDRVQRIFARFAAADAGAAGNPPTAH